MDFTSFTKMNSKWTIDFTFVKHKSIKLLEENVGKNLNDFAFGNSFLDTTPKAQSMKEKTDKLDFIKIVKTALRKTLLRE